MMKTVNAEELLEMMRQAFLAGDGFTLTVTGYSMSPTLKHLRDQVYLVSPSRRKIQRGEIVFFRRKDGACILHRILQEKDGRLVINGDAQLWTEEIERDQVLAVAEGINRNGKYISCSSPVYRAYVVLWRMLKPARGFLISGVSLVKKVSGREKRNRQE